MQKLFILAQHLAPQHLLSRLLGRIADSRLRWLKDPLINRFINTYDVNMSEAVHDSARDYDCFNTFFTRPLKPDARPIDPAEHSIVSPADGAVSAIGMIDGKAVFQAKGRQFSLPDLLGGDELLANQFVNGSFVTAYLSPRDYHRVHMPLAGALTQTRFIPGKLFSVNQVTANHIDGLFARNERIVCLFDSNAGPMAVIMVGAMIVGSIETVWSGRVYRRDDAAVTDYRNRQPAIQLGKGVEMGRFLLGSTVIVLFGPGAMHWRQDLETGSILQMGQAIGSVNP